MATFVSHGAHVKSSGRDSQGSGPRRRSPPPPVVPASAETLEDAEHPRWLAHHGQLVLFADDVAEVRALYGSALRRAGFDVEEARDGQEAVEKALMLRPDVIVLDYVMPRMDGDAVYRILSAHPRTRAIPIVLLSAFSHKLPPVARFGCAAFLAKPAAIDDQALDDLCGVVRRLVAAKDSN